MKKLVFLLLTLTIVISSFVISADASQIQNFQSLEYPEEAISNFSEDILHQAKSEATFTANQGYGETGTYISPYWQCNINNQSVTVYSALSFNYTENIGVLHSYSRIWIDLYKKEITINLKSILPEIENVKVLPSSYNVKCNYNNKTISFAVSKYGTYTILINNGSAEYAYTLFVEKYTDESIEIENYKNKYGTENVLVFEKSYNEFDKLDLNNYDVIYFCRGSYIKATHLYEITNAEQQNNIPEHRNFLYLQNKENTIIDGCGTFDFTSCDWKEVDPMFVTSCKNCKFSGLNFINPCHWTFYTYGCENLEIENISVIGYRTNSDGINICNSRNVAVANCFARNGDDGFSVKTLNSSCTCENVIFNNCVAWSTKARCFGITGEVEADINNITFKDCTVIDRSATWDNDRIGSLCIIAENGKGNITDITFENIEINNDEGRAINCNIYGEGLKNKVENITFKNILYNSKLKSKISTDNNSSLFKDIFGFFKNLIGKLFNIDLSSDEAYINVTFENITANDEKINKYNSSSVIENSGNTKILYK